jgi:hypothetical protein
VYVLTKVDIGTDMTRKRPTASKPGSESPEAKSVILPGDAQAPPPATDEDQEEAGAEGPSGVAQDAQARARAREAERRDAELAMTEYQAKQKAIAERTARLRAQRLARETSKTPRKR